MTSSSINKHMTSAQQTPSVNAIAALLQDLTQVQSEMLGLLQEKQKAMLTRSPHETLALQQREEKLYARLQECQENRQKLLNGAAEQGLPCDSIASLAEALPASDSGELREQIRDSKSRMRILQHQSLTNWVVAQRALLHVSQLLEIIATGGRMQPTYGNTSAALTTGCLLNSEA
jgi:hypothetical protein